MDLSTLGLDYDMDSDSGDNRIHVYAGIDLKEEYKKRVDSVDNYPTTPEGG